MTDILDKLDCAWNEDFKANLMHYCDLAAQEIRKLRKDVGSYQAEVVHTQDELGELLHAAEAKVESLSRPRSVAQRPAHPMALSDLLTNFKIGDSTLRDILWAWQEPEYPSVQEVLHAQQFAADQIDAIASAVLALSSTMLQTPGGK